MTRLKHALVNTTCQKEMWRTVELVTFGKMIALSGSITIRHLTDKTILGMTCQ